MEDILRNEIIVNCLDRKNLIVDYDKIDNPQLLENEDFKRIDSSVFEIDLDSKKNKASILTIAKEKLGRDVPLGISDALKFVFDFEEELKKPETNVSWAGLIELRHALAGFVLAEIHNEGNENLVEFVIKRLKEKNKDEPHLRNIEAYFFEALINVNMTANEFFKTIRSYNTSVPKTNISYKAITFAQKIGQQKVEIAKEIYTEMISSNDWEIEFGVLPAHLLTGIYKIDPNYSFVKAKEALANHPIHSLFFFGRIDYSTQNDLQEVIEISKEIEPNDEQTVNQLIYLLTAFLKSKLANEAIVDFCFKRFQVLFDSEITENKLAVIDAMTNWIESNDEERYYFLLKNIQNLMIST